MVYLVFHVRLVGFQVRSVPGFSMNDRVRLAVEASEFGKYPFACVLIVFLILMNSMRVILTITVSDSSGKAIRVNNEEGLMLGRIANSAQSSACMQMCCSRYYSMVLVMRLPCHIRASSRRISQEAVL